jgi:hypothetical protein
MQWLVEPVEAQSAVIEVGNPSTLHAPGQAANDMRERGAGDIFKYCLLLQRGGCAGAKVNPSRFNLLFQRLKIYFYTRLRVPTFK